jgi:hypothetical protein
MKTVTLVILLVLSSTSFAQGSTLKQGLWEIKPISQIRDGQDMGAQMAAAQAQMQQSLAKMPPEQRKQMQAMMGQQGSPAGGGTRICVSAAMAAKDKPMVDSEGRCEPSKVSRSGNKSSFEFNCTTEGRTMVGKGETTASGDTLSTRMDMTTTDASGRHSLHSEVQMRYLGADCQGVKPIDPLVIRETRGSVQSK